MTLNEAHKAGFEELDNSVRLLALRVRATDGEAREKALEDLEDTHERALQLRVFHNNTLTAELEERQKDLDEALATIRRHTLFYRGVVLVAGAAAVSAAALSFPATAAVAAAWLSTPPLTVALTAAVTYKLTSK